MSAIGIFDSGVGGLTILKEIEKILPEENLLYFGDTARLPYGNKSPETIIRYTLKSAQFLVDQGVKLLIIACHTASSRAMEILQQKIAVPVIGVVQPGIELLLSATTVKRVAVLGTKSTVDSEIYQKLIPSSMTLYSVACPLFVPLVEECLFDHEAALMIANHYLDPIKGKIDAALLACTHYPLLKKVIQDSLGPSVKIVEPATACAMQAKELLTKHSLLNKKRSHDPKVFSTDRLTHLSLIAKTFLGKELESIDWVNID